MDLVGAEIELIERDHRESILRTALAALREQYDYILIDCPPALSIITTNALCAADTLLIPIQCEYYALEGLSQLMNTVRRIKRQYNDQLDIEGVLLTMYDGRLNLTQQVQREKPERRSTPGGEEASDKISKGRGRQTHALAPA